ncbi:MAG: SprT family zinc-dependent metalloprotease [Rickettsiales bacterium]|nr:MAG: SprT family zinc-dependent metalloprotease [Rickettsiales bacterium]
MIFEINDKKIEIVINRKKIKHTILKVKSSVLIEISAPMRLPEKNIFDFINSKKDWIETTILRMSKIQNNEDFADGNYVKILGQKYKIVIKHSIKNYISIEGENLLIETAYLSKAEQNYNEWLKTQALNHFTDLVNKMWQIVGIFPTIQVKKIHRTWGICHCSRKNITFNLELYKQNPDFVEYVVLHELVHFIYPNHSKQFYQYIAKYMPDWRIRKRNMS